MSNMLVIGAKQQQFDITAKSFESGQQLYLDFSKFNNFKLLKTMLHIKGNIEIKLPSNATSATNIKITYKSDHFYKLFRDFQIRLNSNIVVKSMVDLSFLRFSSAFENLGYETKCIAPKTATIPSGANSVKIPYELFTPIWFMLPDAIQATKCFIMTELFNTIQANFTVAQPNDVLTLDNKNATASFTDSFVEGVSDYWRTPNQYFDFPAGTSADIILSRYGSLYKVDTIEKNFSSTGQNQYIELSPTNNDILKSLIIVTRDSATGQRVDNYISKITITDGKNPLVDTTPDMLREVIKSRYNLPQAVYNETDPSTPDEQGIYYGVNRVDTSWFGDLDNSILATANMSQPKIYFQIDSLEGLTGDLQVQVFQETITIPQYLQAKANAGARKLQEV